jgi:nucleotide-binding universal stress UspA family protein
MLRFNSMTLLSSILVDIDSAAASHPALEQALELAVSCSARVKAVEVVPEVPAKARGFFTLALED